MDAKYNSTLRMTLVLPHQKIPTWLQNILLAVIEADYILLSVVVLATKRCPYERNAHLFHAWKRFDYRVIGRRSSEAQHTECLVDLNEELGVQRDCDFSTSTLENVATCIQGRVTDLIVWMAFDRPPPELVYGPKFGVWTLANGVSISTGFWELAGRIPVTACELIRFGAASVEDRVLSRAFAATDRLSLTRSLVAVRAKDQTLLMSMLKKVHRHGDHAIAEVAQDQPAQSDQTIPSLLQLLWALGKIYGRYVIGLVKRPFYFDQWQLAYKIGGDRLTQEGLKRLAPMHKGFWADPFVIRRGGRTVIFFEELPEGECRGKIAVIEVQSDGRTGLPSIVLERDCHLSYPFLFEFEGALFMTPESAESERVEAFRCIRFPDQWESHAVLLDGVRAFDPTLIEHDGRWWMFTTIQHDGSSSDDELHLFYAPGPFDEWTPHPLNPIIVDVRSARPAGALFREQEQLFRPAQDCSVRYGYALSIQKILRMNTREYDEVETRRILPDWAPGAQGTHTVNHSAGVTVYDCLARRRK